jgi:beta-lactam-binding protein with PASTA domain
VPNVTGQDVSVARATLENNGFRVREVIESTEDPDLDGIVLDQDPLSGAQREPGALVTLYVGGFVAPQDTTETSPPS